MPNGFKHGKSGVGVRRWKKFSLNEISLMERLCVVWEQADGHKSEDDDKIFERLKKEIDIEKNLRALERDMQALEDKL